MAVVTTSVLQLSRRKTRGPDGRRVGRGRLGPDGHALFSPPFFSASPTSQVGHGEPNLTLSHLSTLTPRVVVSLGCQHACPPAASVLNVSDAKTLSS